jgi:fluoroquinolone transport system ATP-binding protein
VSPDTAVSPAAVRSARPRRGGCQAIVAVEGLHCAYPGADAPVLHGLDFAIGEGEVFGFLGPNGSGKSTTQKILTRVLHGWRGSVRVFDDDLARQGVAYHNRIGVCFEFPNLYERLSAEENLEFYRRLFDVPTEEPRALLERLDLPTGDRRPVSTWSKGMRMRAVLARSLVNRPRLWFLDEPTTGQDPEHAVRVRRLIREAARDGTTVFLTTHDMTVADELCDRVAFLVDGRIVALDAPRALKLAHTDRRVRVEVREGDALCAHEFDLEDPDRKEAFLALVRGASVETIHTLEPTLEDVFLRVTGRGLLA